jgi:hypothetical protein
MKADEHAALLRLRAAIDVLIEKGFGDGRGCEADAASTEVAKRFGQLPIERARAERLRDALRLVCETNDGTGRRGIEAIRVARRELEHDQKVFR